MTKRSRVRFLLTFKIENLSNVEEKNGRLVGWLIGEKCYPVQILSFTFKNLTIIIYFYNRQLVNKRERGQKWAIY